MKNEKLKISISLILPIYNEESIIEDSLKKCISALERDFEDYEIILVDDGSKDKSINIAENLCSDNPNVKIIKNLVNLNQGISIQRGFACATKEIIMHNGIDLPFNPEETKNTIFNHWNEIDVLVLERKKYSGATIWRKLTSKVNIILRRILFPKISKGITDMNFIQFYSKEILRNIMPLAKSPAFTTPEMIFRAKYNKYKLKNISFDFVARPVGNGSLGKVHDITWSIYDMLRFRYLLWIGLKKHGRIK